MSYILSSNIYFIRRTRNAFRPVENELSKGIGMGCILGDTAPSIGGSIKAVGLNGVSGHGDGVVGGDGGNVSPAVDGEGFKYLNLVPRIHDGAIVLLHSTSATNAAILDELLSKWEGLGYQFASLDDLPLAETMTK